MPVISAPIALSGDLYCGFCGSKMDLLRSTLGPNDASGVPLIAHESHRTQNRTAWLLFCSSVACSQATAHIQELSKAKNKTCKWHLEMRVTQNASEVAFDLARHLFTRFSSGTAVVVADKPIIFLAPFRKSWLYLMRIIQLERARSLEKDKIKNLSGLFVEAKNLPFTATNPEYHQGVVIVSPQDCQKRRADSTVYIVSRLSDDQLQSLLQNLQEGAVVVDYVGQIASYIAAKYCLAA